MGHCIQLIRKYCFLLPLLIARMALCADLPPDTKQEIIADFSGGLNTNSNSNKVDKRFSKNLRNILLDEKDGSLVKRNGFVAVGSTRTMMGATLMFTFNKENGDKEFIVSDSSIVLTTRDFQTFTFISSGLTTTNNLSAVQVRNKVWMSNGTDPVFTWDGTSKQILNGTNGLPNVPTGKYLAYWQERVWNYNKPSDASALDFTSVITTDGVIIAPDDNRAWPAINELEIGRGDGQVGSSLWVQDGQLQAGKTASVYTIFGTNPSNYLPRKVMPDIGVISNDSVGLLDGNAYWLDQNGIYENGQRISDNITPSVEAILKPTNRTIQNLWETESDFKRGSVFSGTTVTATGLVTILSSDVIISNQVSDTSIGISSFVFTSKSTATPWMAITTNSMSGVPPQYLGLIGIGDQLISPISNEIIYLTANGGPCGAPAGTSPKMTLKNARTNSYIAKTFNSVSSNLNGVWTQTPIDFQNPDCDVNSPCPPFSQAVQWTFDDIRNGNFQYKVEINTGACSSFEYDMKFATEVGRLVLTPSTTGSFVSDVTTETSVTAWGVFDSIRNTNGGSINYYFHTSTSAVTTTTQTWIAITPGTIIGAPTINNYIQWTATITSVSTAPPMASNIDNVTIDHIEGQSSKDRAFAVTWKNRYWLAIATETSGNFSIIYVKTKKSNPNPNAWMPYQNINIRSFTKDGADTLYGGAASTGVFYRLDYGTNDNGAATDALYDVPDLNLGDPFRASKLVEFELDIDRKPGGSLIIGASKDFGSYSTKTFSFDGTNGTANMPVIFDNIYGKVMSFRIQHNQLDVPMSVNNLGIYYQQRYTR